MADLGDMIARLLLDTTAWSAGMKKMEEDTAKGTGGVEGAFGAIGAGLSTVTSALGGVALGEKLFEFGKASVEAAEEFGRFRTAITNMRGDSKEVEDFLENVDNIADKSPFEFPELAGSAQRMVQLGGNLEDVTKTLSGVVDMGTALKWSAAQVDSVMNSLGNLQAGMDPMRVLNKLVKEGVPAWQMLAEQTGKSIGEVKEAVKSGAMSNKEVLDALTADMGKYHEAAEKWGTGFKGSMKGLHEAVDESMKGIGTAIIGALNTVAAPAIQGLTKLIEGAQKVWDSFPTPIKTAIMVFGGLVAAIAPLVALWPVIMSGVAAVTAALGGFTAALAGPVLPIVALVAALAGLAMWISEHWEGITDILTAAWDNLAEIWGGAWNTVVTTLTGIWEGIKSTAVAIWEGITAVIGGIWDFYVGLWTTIWNTITGVLTAAWNGISTGASTIFGTLVEWLGGVFEPVVTAITATWNKLVNFFGPIMQKLGATAGIVTDSFKAITEEMGKAVPAAEKVEKSNKGVANAMDDTSKAAKEQTDKLKPLHQQNLILAEMAAKLQGEHKKLATEVANAKLAQDKLAASGKTLADVVTDIIPPTTNEAAALLKLNEAAGKAMATIKGGLPTVDAAEQALKDMGIQSTRVAEAAVDQAREQQKVVEAAGNMVSQYDRLAAQANTTKKEIEFLSKAGGDNTAALEALRKKLTETEAAMNGMKLTTVEAYHQMGLQTAAEMNQLALNAEAAYKKIAEDAGINSIAAKQAWITKTEEAYANVVQQGGKLTEDQKTELAKMKVNVEDALKPIPGVWETMYGSVKQSVGGAFDDIVTKLVTGKGSFKEIITGLWQDIATAALDTFLAPVKKAISDFIATEIADLLGGKGLGGLSDALGGVGKLFSGIFGHGADAAAGALPALPAAGLPAVPGIGGGAADVASKAVSTALSTVVGMVTGIVSAISGVIGNFQMAKMETSLNAIEHNTRYTMMYVGERADGGILGILFKIDEEIAWGPNTKATENHRDLFKDWSNPMLSVTQAIRDALYGLAPYVTDIKTVLEDVRTAAQDGVRMMGEAMQDNSFRSITVNVSPSGLTTAEAARVLGDHIATNLTRQLVPMP